MKNPELNLAWQFVKNTGTHVFLTGRAGTGKTTFLRTLKEQLPKRMIVLAPTGIAAINAGGVTIHSFFQLPFSPYIPNTTFRAEGTFRFGREKQRIIRTTDLLVIDEISMVRADLLDAVDTVLRRYRDHGRPFGGVQLLLIGDLQQLPPVVKDADWALLSQYYDSPYFFSSNALRQTEYVTIELKTVYRQSDAAFLDLLNRIRENRADADTFQQLNRRVIPHFNPPEEEGYIRLTTHNHQAQQVNEAKLSEIELPSTSFRAEVEGTFPEQSYPTDEVLTLKRHAQVMFVKNDTTGQGRYYNGMLGRVTELSPRGITVQNADGEEIELDREEWTNARYVLDKKTQEIREEVEGIFRQYPLRLAWAVTIHKSQGLTFDRAIIDAQHSFAHGQTYVALSRCRTLEGLVLSAPLNAEAVICDEKVSRFNAYAAAHQPTQETLSKMEQAYRLSLVDELFDFRPLGIAFERMARLVDEHFHRNFPRLAAEYRQVRPQLDELVMISAKFRHQYAPMLTAERPAQSLPERIRSAATYFRARLAPLADLHHKTSISTDNPSLKTTLRERQLELDEALRLKIGLLKHESQAKAQFEVGDYLAAKTRLLLGDPIAETRRPRKERKEKAPKADTHQVSLSLLRQGLDIAAIARQRGLALSTVASHLVRYVAQGEVDVRELVDERKRQEIVRFLLRHPDEKKNSGEVKAAVAPDISYEDIKLVLADFYSQRP